MLVQLLPKGIMFSFFLQLGGCSLMTLDLKPQPASPNSATPAAAEPAQVSNYRQKFNDAIQDGQQRQQQNIDQVEKQ